MKIWSLATRLFHWTLVLLVAAAYITSEKDLWLHIHIAAGFLILALLLFRLYYGFYGPPYSLFKNFLASPEKLLSHMKDLSQGHPPAYRGHNPPAGWMIVTLLLLLFLLSVTGLFVGTGEENYGVLGGDLSTFLGEFFKEIHEGLALLLGLSIFVHISGVLIDSFLHRSNLVISMITGRKTEDRQYHDSPLVDSPEKSRSFGALALLFLSLLATGALYYQTAWVKIGPADLTKGGAAHELWKAECSDCHELFHPSLLPKRSWVLVMKGLSNHFGDDASLEEEEQDLIESFLVRYAAENSRTEAAYKISHSLPRTANVLRITDSPYWIRKHREIPQWVYKNEAVGGKTRCSSCHEDALTGEYEDDAITQPIPWKEKEEKE